MKMTMVPPVGRLKAKEKIMPLITDKREKKTEAMIVFLKLKESCSAVTGVELKAPKQA